MLTSEEALIAEEAVNRWNADNFIWIDDDKKWLDDEQTRQEPAVRAAERLRTGDADPNRG